MKISELRELNKDELAKALHEKRQTLKDLRFEIAQGKVKNAHVIRSTKKDVAQILTVFNSIPTGI
ncbi:MAG: 50S ribosomal protein L29 [Parcubacteria group bacterium]|nr:50S ribosomal protein L29 [Parcubacteria group bacterium]